VSAGIEAPAGVERDYPLARLTTIRTGGAADYFTRSKTRCDAILPIMPSTVIVLPSALIVVLDVPVPPGPATEAS